MHCTDVWHDWSTTGNRQENPPSTPSGRLDPVVEERAIGWDGLRWVSWDPRGSIYVVTRQRDLPASNRYDTDCFTTTFQLGRR